MASLHSQRVDYLYHPFAGLLFLLMTENALKIRIISPQKLAGNVENHSPMINLISQLGWSSVCYDINLQAYQFTLIWLINPEVVSFTDFLRYGITFQFVAYFLNCCYIQDRYIGWFIERTRRREESLKT